VAGDTNGVYDYFVRDRRKGTTVRVSVSSSGEQQDDDSKFGYNRAGISSDGRFVAFESSATNLVAGDTNGVQDIFVHDLLTGTTVCANVASSGAQANSDCFDVALSGDGRHVVFTSYATNLVTPDINPTRDVFVHDLVTGTTVRANADVNGSPGLRASAYPSISHDGRFVAFGSDARLVGEDTNRVWEVYVRDLVAGTTERVSVATDGTQGNNASSYPSISADGRFVVFETLATNLALGDTNADWDVYVHDRLTSTTAACSVTGKGSVGNGSSYATLISANGERVVFKSTATDLVPGDANMQQDIFVHDLVSGTTQRASIATDGAEADGHSSQPAISGDGKHIGFFSTAANLVPNDTNDEADVFVRTLRRVRPR
jgi:Tol biopolymer transport system component